MRPVIVYSLVLGALGVVALVSLSPDNEAGARQHAGFSGYSGAAPRSRAAPRSGPARADSAAEVERRAVELLRAGDISKVMELFELLTGTDHLDFEWRLLGQRLARESPESGFQWLCRLPSTDLTRVAMDMFGYMLAGNNPALAARLWPELDSMKPEPALRGSFCAGVIWGEAAQSPDAAFELVNKFSRSKEERESFLMGLAARLGTSAQKETVLQMAERFPDLTDPVFVGEALYAVWKKDPATAQQWIERMPDAMRVAEACNTLAYEYAKEAPAAAAEWVKTLPAGEVRDRSVLGLARAISNAQPLEALQWAVSVQGEQNRAAGVSTLVGPAIARDLAAARQIVESSTLSPAEKEKWAGFIERAIPVWRPAR